jgi:uncharacterized protein
LSSIVKALLIIAGTISLALGILGIFLPLLPTTPFLLLTSACYIRSSDRLHDWLMSNKHLGGYIRNFKERRGLTLKAKIITLSMLWASLGYSIYRVNRFYVGIGLVIMGCCTSTYLIRMKTLKENE